MISYSILFHYYLHLCAMPLSAYLFEDFAKSIRTIISRVICFIVCFRLLLWGFFCFSFLFFFCFVSLGFFVSLALLYQHLNKIFEKMTVGRNNVLSRVQVYKHFQKTILLYLLCFHTPKFSLNHILIVYVARTHLPFELSFQAL